MQQSSILPHISEQDDEDHNLEQYQISASKLEREEFKAY